MEPIHRFDNGVKVFRHHLLEHQIVRYRNINLHEPVEEELFRSCLESLDPEHSSFCDFGAGIGYYSILAKRLYPPLETHMFEPNPKFVESIKANLKLNGLDENLVCLHPLAIANRAGMQALRLKDYGSSLVFDLPKPAMHILRIVHRLFPDQDIAYVRSTTIDRVIALIGHQIDLAKIDVQGAEARLLQGARRSLASKKIRYLLVGTHSPRLHQQCLEILREYEYSILDSRVQVEHQPDGLIMARS